MDALLRDLEAVGGSFTLVRADGREREVGGSPDRARITLCDAGVEAHLAARDLLAIAEAYLDGRIDVEGDFREVIRLTEVMEPGPGLLDRLRLGAQLWFRDRRRLQAESVSFHYDRPAEFFLPWFERWRSYSHGLYEASDDPPEKAQARKLQAAIDALGLRPGMRVFDMGCGWGAFLEYAGLQGIEVHGITISAAQHAFVERLIEEQALPCSVERVDFLDHVPPRRYDGAVFMGTFEHVTDYRAAARWLARHLRDDAALWADFCSAREGHQVGAFLGRHIWPGTARYVEVPRLSDALIRVGFNLWELSDDTWSYALTCRDWADAFDACAPELAEAFGERSVRAFRVYLRASAAFLATNRTQAYHLVASRAARGVRSARERHQASPTTTEQSAPNRSPTRA